ncbi:hypothetical protein ASC87_20050 [Rhizobacter sp. Root1221]|nr:hypothetical protein ASC87_20050 [Rhizobacter sp. Root1221]
MRRSAIAWDMTGSCAEQPGDAVETAPPGRSSDAATPLALLLTLLVFALSELLLVIALRGWILRVQSLARLTLLAGSSGNGLIHLGKTGTCLVLLT